MRRIIVFFLCFFGFIAPGETVLYEYSFQNGPENWQSSGNASWSPEARRPGKNGSLVLRFEQEKDSLPAWRSPVLKLDGRAVKIGFWAADNYLRQQDYSYSAGISVKRCNADGVPETELAKVYTEWDNSLVSPYMWGMRTRENAVWKYYEMEIGPGNPFIRLFFDFRAPLVRGRCLLTDVRVTESTKKSIPLPEQKNSKSETRLLLSSPASGGLFFQGDSLRFDAFLYQPSAEKINLPEKAYFHVEVCDFERNPLAEMRVDAREFTQIRDGEFYKSEIARKRKITPENHAVKRFILDDPAAKQPGILFLLKAELVSDKKVLVSDTILYGVVEPLPAVKNPEKSFFFTRDQGVPYYDSLSTGGKSAADQEFVRKMRSTRIATLDNAYNWSKLQKKWPGPILIPELLPEIPKNLYMPNIEQVRVARMIPKGASIPEKNPVFYAGRKGMLQFDYHAEAYADFIVEYVKRNHHAITHVIPSGLERPFSHRVPILQKKVYEELKKFDPSIQIGFTINFIRLDDFRKHELFRYTDFLNVHMYGSSLGFPFDDKVDPYKNFYKTVLKKKVPPFTLTEGAMRPPPGYLNYASGTVRGIWSLLENGFTGIYYYHQRNRTALENPDITDSVTSDPTSPGYDNYRFVQLADRPVFAPEIVMKPGSLSKRWRPGDGSGGGCSIMPTPAAMAYYNLIHDFDYLPFQRMRLRGGCKIYSFGDHAKNICGIEPLEGAPEQLLLVKSASPYIFRDLLGRITRMVPVGNLSVIQPGKYPCTLIFDSPGDIPEFTALSRGFLSLPAASPGSELPCRLEPPFSASGLTFGIQLSGPEKIRGVLMGNETGFSGTIPLPADLKPGKRPVRAFLRKGDAVCGIYHTELNVPDSLEITLEKCVKTAGKEAGFAVQITNSSARQADGTICFEDRWFSRSPSPAITKRKFSVPPHETKQVFFQVPDEMIRMNFNEVIALDVLLSGDEKRTVRGRIHFRASPYVEKPPVIDGDLSDWNLSELYPVPLERVRMTDVDLPVPENRSSPGKFYSVWHGDTVYFAVAVEDTTPQSRSMDLNLWMDDNLLIGIYPWITRTGEKLHAGYYREHIGFHKDGTTGKYRAGNYIPSDGEKDMKNVRAVVKKTSSGYIYEIAYPVSSLFPLKLEPGGGFRLSLTNFDARDFRNVPYFYGELSYFGGAAVNYHTNPELWFEFLFAK